MTTPTDPSDRSGGPGDDDAATARLLRAALGGPGDGPGDGSETQDDDGARPLSGAAASPREVPAPLLRAIERRAVKHHRRRQARTLGGAAAAAAAVVLVGGLVLPQLGSLGGAMSASGGSADSGGSVGFQSGTDAGAGGGSSAESRNESGGDPAAAPTALSGSAASAQAPPVSAASLLTAADVTAFSDVPVQAADPFAETGQSFPLGACVGGNAGILEPVALWRVDLNSDPTALSDREPPGLSERVVRFADPGQAAGAVETVRADAATCTGPGLEGTGPTTELDAAAVTPDGGSAVVLAGTAGQGAPTLQVLVTAGGVLMQLQITSNADTQELALADATDTIRTAVTRATGAGYSTAPAAPTAAAGGGG